MAIYPVSSKINQAHGSIYQTIQPKQYLYYLKYPPTPSKMQEAIYQETNFLNATLNP
jgi:hypothetical protein